MGDLFLGLIETTGIGREENTRQVKEAGEEEEAGAVLLPVREESPNSGK